MSSAADDEHKREEEEVDLDDLLDGALFHVSAGVPIALCGCECER